MKIDIQFIPPDEQRYDTLGDWFWEGDALHIRASLMDTSNESFLVALHEMVEAWLCGVRGVDQAAVDAFDMAFAGDGEPGDDPASPYRREHRFSSLIEHLVAHELGIVDYGNVS